MAVTIRQFKAAAVQSEPAWFDLQQTVEKTISLIIEAGEKDCKLIVFGETWIPGYPWWQWCVSHQDSLPLLKKYHQNSLKSDSKEMRSIRAAAKRSQIYVSLGYSEIEGSSLYMAQVLIDPSGRVINHRRKIKPTHAERLVFGEGTGDSLDNVTDTQIGLVGQLNCWEHMNPFLKAHAVALHEQIHVAAWPVLQPEAARKYPDPYTATSEYASELATPAYASETGTWTVAASQLLSREGARSNLPEHLRDDATLDGLSAWFDNGFARIYRPDGSKAVQDPDKKLDGLLIAEIDLDEIIIPKILADYGGHYNRPDLLRLMVDKTPKIYVVDANSPDPDQFTTTLVRLGLDKPLADEE
ncbi:unnamed protein product [Clonostachys rosea]|uniref:CN hydrolase domain-containing protein n=1 Tax=Bionectria ochroleuca TaxID=29856 RepID=A0ABY6U3U0_BIOOC|nr:unnamed protein product [Clonostachys rosea]